MPFAPQKQLLDSQTQEEVLRNFETHWDEDKLVEQASQIPPGAPWRAALLRELVKIDLRRQWQKGNKRSLESYLLKYPELGTPETVAFELIQAEMQVRRRAGDNAFGDLCKRFPRQMGQLQRGLAHVLGDQDHPTAEDATAPAVTDTLMPAAAPALPSPAVSPPAARPVTPPQSFRQPPPHDPSVHVTDTLKPVESAAEISLASDTAKNAAPKDRYTILRELGRGAMGTVYLAQDTILNRQVAMKIPHFQPGEGPEMRKRFMREARAAAVLNHPNICPIYDVGERTEIPYLTMAYIEGNSLDKVLRETRPMAPRRAVEIVYKLACALDEAHRHGVVHRDLKPGNVMMNHRGDPVIMDFGLARQADDVRMTHQGSVLGTPAYMSPEQVRGDLELIGPPSDQYSLGVILYELLTGQVPFRGSIGVVMSKILSEAPKRPTELRPDLDPTLEQICLKAMAMQIADRFASVGDFSAALEPFLRAPATSPGFQLPPSSMPVINVEEGSRPSSKPSIKLSTSGGGDEGIYQTANPSAVAINGPAVVEGPDATDTLTSPNQPEWKKPSTHTHKALGMTLRQKAPAKPFPVVAVVVVLLSLIGGVVGYILLTGAETAEHFRQRIQSHIDKDEYSVALDEIDKAKDQEEKPTKETARQSVRKGVIAWIEPQLKTARNRLEAKQALDTTKQDVKKLCDLLKRLLEAFPGDEQLTGPYKEAQKLGLQILVEELVSRQEFGAALLEIDRAKKTFADPKWAEKEKARVLERGRNRVRSLLGDDRRFDRAVKAADDILAIVKEDREVKALKDTAQKKIESIGAKVDEFIRGEKFVDAFKFVEENWPEDEQRFRDKIKIRWYEAAATHKSNRKWDEARQALVALKKKYPDEGTEVEKRLLEVQRAHLLARIDDARQSKKLALLKEAEKLLQGEEGKLLDNEQRASLLLQIGKLMAIPARITDAVAQLKGLDNFKEVREHLLELSNQVDESSKARIAAVLGILKQAEDVAGADPLSSKELNAFEPAFIAFAKNPIISSEDTEALTRVYDGLLERRIKSSMLRFPEQGKWAQGLADCLKVKTPTPWVRAWQLECTTEQLARSGDEISKEQKESLQKGLQALQGLSAYGDEAAAYLHYLHGMVDALLTNPTRAAASVQLAYAGKKVSPLLAVKYRKGRAAAALLEAATALHQERDLAAPFGTKENAGLVYDWLKRAQALNPEQKGLRLPLVLAAWYRSSPDRKLVTTEVVHLVDSKTLEDLPLQDAYLVLVLHADTRDDTLKGRTEAIASYEQAVAKAHELLGRNPMQVAFSEHVYRSVIAPVVTDQGKQVLGGHTDVELKHKLGFLCARIGQMVRSDQFIWSKVEGLGKNPLKTVAQLYGQAYHLVGKAKFLVLRDFIQADVTAPTTKEQIAQLEVDANKAIEMEKDYWGGHSLKGFAQFLRSRRTGDYAERVKLLRAADLYFGQAATCLNGEDDNKEDLSTFYRYRSSVCLELANFLFGQTDEKAKYIRDAETYALKATKLNARSFDAWDALAYAREDVAWVLKEVNKYAQAKEAFDQAILISFRIDRVRPWLGRGRTLFRWATVPNELEKMTEAERARKMKDAESDLAEVLKRKPQPLEEAEACYWQATIALFHCSKARSDKKREQFLVRSEKLFEESLALARKAHSAQWEEAVLAAHSNLALAEGLTLDRRDPGKARSYYQKAVKLAVALSKYNLPEAARIHGKAVFQLTRDKDKVYAIYTKGLETDREQDLGSLVNLYCERANLRLTMEPADLNAVIKDARAAVKTAKKAHLDRKQLAYARGTLAKGLYVSSIALSGDARSERRAEALPLFREAIQDAPKHRDSYMWRWFLVEILCDKSKLSNKEWAEASENIRRAAATAPSSEVEPAVRDYLTRINQLNGWFSEKK